MNIILIFNLEISKIHSHMSFLLKLDNKDYKAKRNIHIRNRIIDKRNDYIA